MSDAVRKALEFYANEKNYFDGDGKQRVNPNRSSAVDADAGKRARAVLSTESSFLNTRSPEGIESCQAKLKAIHSALDAALGDSDIQHLDDDELREHSPVQWAAQELAKLIASTPSGEHFNAEEMELMSDGLAQLRQGGEKNKRRANLLELAITRARFPALPTAALSSSGVEQIKAALGVRYENDELLWAQVERALRAALSNGASVIEKQIGPEASDSGAPLVSASLAPSSGEASPKGRAALRPGKDV